MNNAKFLVPLLGLLALAGSFAARADVNDWSITTPAGGGASVNAIAAHPTNGSIALLGTSRGLFRSTDGGMTWSLKVSNARNPPDNILFDPTNPARVVFNDGSLHLSTDGGQTFGIVQGPNLATNIAVLGMAADATLYAVYTDGRLFKAPAPYANWTEQNVGWAANSWPMFVTTDPSDSQTLYVGILGAGIYRSTNGGANWSAPLTTGFSQPANITFVSLAVDPTDSMRLLTATGAGIYLSTNRGASWTSQDAASANWVGFDPADPNSVVALRGLDVARSTDRGLHWSTAFTHRAGGLHNAAFLAAHGGLLVALSTGVAYSSDLGPAFTYRNVGLSGYWPRSVVASDDAVYALMSLADGDIYQRNDSVWVPLDPPPLLAAITGTRSITGLAVAAGDSRQIFAINSFSQLIRTFDHGAHWTAPHPAFLPSTGDYATGVVIDPSNPQIAYVWRGSTGIWKTIDGGTTFTQLVNSPTYVGVVSVSPHDGAVLYAAASGSLNLNPSGIYKSIDGGDTWVEQLAPVSNVVERSIESITFHPTDPGVIYASAFADGILKTTDGGGHWTNMSFAQSGETYVPVHSVLLDPLLPTTMWVVSTGSSPGFLRSVDGGNNWEKVPFSISGSPLVLTGAVLDPANSSKLIAVSSVGMAEYQVAPDQGLAMTSIANSVPRGGSVSSTFTVTNSGPHASSLSSVLIDVPSWITPSGAGCTMLGQSLNCLIGALEVGQSKSVLVTFDVAANATGSGQIHAVLQTHELDPETANNEVSQAVQAAEIADVDVAIAAASATVDRGGSTSVTVTVSNSGPSPSTATQSTVTLPANTSASNLVSSVGSCTQNAGAITCGLGTLAANTSATLTFALRGDIAGQGTLSASAAGAGQDPDGQHSGSLDITVRPVADMAVALAESADPVTLGAPFQYTATISNLSGDAAAFIVSIPVTGARVISATTDFGVCATMNSMATCSGTGLAAGATGTMTINLDSAAAGIATATASLNFSGTDSDPANNSANIGTTIRVVGDLGVDLAESADPVFVGSPLSYTATVRNLGPNAGNAHLLITFTGATAASATPSAGGTCTTVLTQIRVDCDFTNLASGASATATIALSTTVAGSASATAQVSFSDTDPVLTNNNATVSTTVNAPAPPSSSSSGGGGGGGGGRFDWLAVGLLGLLLAARRFSRRERLAAGA